MEPEVVTVSDDEDIVLFNRSSKSAHASSFDYDKKHPMRIVDIPEDFEDETIIERICALSEMFPESVRNAATTGTYKTYNSMCRLFSLVRTVTWAASTSFTIGVLPALIIHEISTYAEQYSQQMRQMMLGPAAMAVSGAFALVRRKTTYNMSSEISFSSMDQADMLAEFEKRKRARQIYVSTDDSEVKSNLRQLDEPTCLFGEGPADRRERLRMILSLLSDSEIARRLLRRDEAQPKQNERKQEVTWFHEGSEMLKEARIWIALYSLVKAKHRITEQKQYADTTEFHRTARAQQVEGEFQRMQMHCSQVGDTRPLSYCNISPDDKMLTTSSWSGQIKLWGLPNCNHISTIAAHSSHVSCVVFHPQADLERKSCVGLASCAFDGSVKLWPLDDDKPLLTIDTHLPHRVSKVRFHPSGRFLATCCHDASWRLWDLEQNEEVLHQEGHCGPVVDLDFQPDGSVCVTGGNDTYGRVWDLRTGRCIMFLNGHLKAIVSASFSPNGYLMATGSADHSVKLWDLRQVKETCTIAAHSNIVSQVKFQRNVHPSMLITSSFDQSIKVWSSTTWNAIKVISLAPEQKITSIDHSSDRKILAATSYDRSIRIWCTSDDMLSSA
ncbi:hypothetical protein GJ496_001210 [Pomphorhynchus laevis]|nr:hypothetical protein GJ496_001210 [Pomphorhynchus laevis]